MQLPTFFSANILLAQYTTYKLGGPAKYFAEPQSIDQIKECILWAQENNIVYYIIGKGSNLVVSDQGYDGLIIFLGPNHFGKINIENQRATIQAGALLHSVVLQSVKSGLSGIENLGGIPGTVGGGAYINAGAFDQELSEVITKVTSISKTGQLIERKNIDCQFAYRFSHFFEVDEIIVEVEMTFEKKDPEALKEQMNTILKKRKEKQPLEYPNAGSMYKRPPGTYAGKLIQEADLKGFKLGKAQISPKHANFVINLGGAKSQDVFDLSTEVILQVEKQSGITLEREQIFIGNFLPWPR